MSPLPLDQLAAFCDEIAAIARAGIPLERGLSEVATEMLLGCGLMLVIATVG